MKKIIFILVVVATGITACNELTSIDDVTTNEDHYSSNTDHYSINTNTVLGVMQSGVPTATVSFSDFNTEINDIAIENGHISGALIAQDIIDEGTYGYSYVYDYQITEISGDTTYFSSSLPVELDGLDFIPDVQNGGLRKK